MLYLALPPIIKELGEACRLLTVGSRVVIFEKFCEFYLACRVAVLQ